MSIERHCNLVNFEMVENLFWFSTLFRNNAVSLLQRRKRLAAPLSHQYGLRCLALTSTLNLTGCIYMMLRVLIDYYSTTAISDVNISLHR